VNSWVAILATAAVGIAGIAATFFAPAHAQERLDERREKRELRVAKRLVLVEIEETLERIDFSRRRIEDAPAVGFEKHVVDPKLLTKDAWKTHRAVLAASLDGAGFRAALDAYSKIEELRLISETMQGHIPKSATESGATRRGGDGRKDLHALSTGGVAGTNRRCDRTRRRRRDPRLTVVSRARSSPSLQ
jgi:hypothetical protein